MWVPSVAIKYFDRLVQTAEDNAEALQNTNQELRQDLAALRAENQLLRTELQSAKVTSDWLRIKVNSLEMENKGLLEKAYNIRLPVPEIARAPESHNPLANFSFDDMGDELAEKLGLPIYGKA